ncbi:hypothetical protein BFP77_03685 [Maribacter sp. 4U21]|nr:hypothetical protein BFP77_03685 [Maribacter sp. 4U21]
MFLFAFAETEIDSGVTAVLNSLVPLFTLFVYLHFSLACWRLVDGATFSIKQLGASLFILVGVYLVNKKRMKTA